MAASAARETQGILLSLTTAGTGGTYTDVGELINITPPTKTLGTIDITNHGTTDYYREFLPGMIDGGTVTFTCNYISSSSWANYSITNEMDNRTKVGWKITLSTGEAASSSQYIWYGNGYISNYQLLTANDSAVQYSVSIKLTAKPTDSADTT